MSHYSLEELEASRKLADGIGISCFVYCGQTYIMDGGAAAYRIGDPWRDAGCGCSAREATEEEIELWRALRGPT